MNSLRYHLFVTSLGLCFCPIFASGGTTGIAGGEAKKPNILWLVSEDNEAKWLGCYGNDRAETPNLDRLAQEGYRYSNAFANAPICSAQRFSWITGMHGLSTGNQCHRSRFRVPDSIPVYPDGLRAAGYHAHNGNKTDYNGLSREGMWDSEDPTQMSTPWENVEKRPWRHAPQGKPFFCIINFMSSHESQLTNLSPSEVPSPGSISLAEYHPDLPEVRESYASYYKAVSNMDAQVGEVLQNLAEDGLEENTIVFYCSDHAGVMPRSKRFLFDSGIHVPLIVRIPEAFRHLRPTETPGSTIDEVVSLIDLPPTFLWLVGADIPELMQGQVFLGPNRSEPRQFHFAWRERTGPNLDNARAVRDDRWLYIRNYAPYAAWMTFNGYIWRKIPMADDWQNAWEDGELEPVSEQFWRPKNAPEELYDTWNDHDCVNNLADDVENQGQLRQMRSALREWQLKIVDTGLLIESERERRAKEAGLTVYEMTRSDEWYDLPAYLDAADLATAGDPTHYPQLVALTQAEDMALRYWGITGLLLLAENQELAMEVNLLALLDDPSHPVRALSAWALIKRGEQTEQAYAVLSGLLDQNSYAARNSVLNMIEWMGEDAAPLVEAVKAYETRVRLPWWSWFPYLSNKLESFN